MPGLLSDAEVQNTVRLVFLRYVRGTVTMWGIAFQDSAHIPVRERPPPLRVLQEEDGEVSTGIFDSRVFFFGLFFNMSNILGLRT